MTGNHPLGKVEKGETLFQAEFLCLNNRHSTSEAKTEGTIFPDFTFSSVITQFAFKIIS